MPKYVDNIHFENLILYQLLMEGSEGGRNMIKEAHMNKQKGKLVDLKTAVNIWRERIPNVSEPLHGVWNEVLENRNFIYDQISQIMYPSNIPQPPQNPTEEQIQIYKQQNEMLIKQRSVFVNEYLDKAWNQYKLTQIARK